MAFTPIQPSTYFIIDGMITRCTIDRDKKKEIYEIRYFPTAEWMILKDPAIIQKMKFGAKCITNETEANRIFHLLKAIASPHINLPDSN